MANQFQEESSSSSSFPVPTAGDERIQTVVFLRHGVAQHNYRGADLTSPKLFDPPLVPAGKMGALEAGQKIQFWFLSNNNNNNINNSNNNKTIELVLSSPLTRCLQTAVLAFLPGDRYNDNDCNRKQDNNSQTLPTQQNPQQQLRDNTLPQQQQQQPQQGDNNNNSDQKANQTMTPCPDMASNDTSSSSLGGAIPIVCVEQVREAFGIHYPDKRRPLSLLKVRPPSLSRVCVAE